MNVHDDDAPLTEAELELSRKGQNLVSAAVADTQAPQSLREAIEGERERAAARDRAPFWRRHRWLLATAGVAVTALAAFAIALQTGSETAAPTLDEVYAAAQLAPTEGAPPTAAGDPPVLDAAVGALEFPDWEEKFDWRAVGRRDDEIAGRDVTTVYYRNAEGERLGYAVVAGEPLATEPAGREVRRDGNSYDVARAGESTIVTWTQQGHTCAIVAPSDVPESTLVDLAASRNV